MTKGHLNLYITLVIYKFKCPLVIRNNSSPSIGVLQKTNVIYKFKCPLVIRKNNFDDIYDRLGL